MPVRYPLALTTLLTASLLAACSVGGPTRSPTPSRRPVVAGPDAVSMVGQDSAAVVSNNGGAVVSQNGANIISNHGGGAVPTTIAGRVLAPAGLLSDSGGSLVSNNGGSLITDNGAGIVANNGGGVLANGGAAFRLAQATGTQAAGTRPAGAPAAGAPVPGVAVELRDAAGQPLLTAAGAPVRAVTDSEGRYTFTGTLPAASNYLLGVELPEQKGRLEAIAARRARRDADLDLVSTLATRYILDQYVGPAAEPQATLDKLPPDVEAATRTRTGAALAAAAEGAPASLDPAAVVEAVEALRAADPALNEQFELVKRLLVAAGQSNLGDGQPALSVALPWIRGLVPLDDGGYYLNGASSRRVFKVGADGVLRTVAGTSGAEAAAVDGQAATGVGLRTIMNLLVAEDGRLLIAEDQRVTRLEPDGTLKQLWPLGTGKVYAVGRAPAGELWVLTQAGCHRVTAAGVATLLRAFSAADLAWLKRVADYGQDPQGRLVLHAAPVSATPFHEVRRLDPATGTFEVLLAPEAADIASMCVDGAGRIFLLGQDKTVRLREGDAAERAFLPAGVTTFLSRGSLAIAKDGSVLLTERGEIYRVVEAAKTLIAGTKGAVADGAGEEGLNRPCGLLVASDGALLVAAAGENRVLRVLNGESRPFAGSGEEGAPGDGGDATAATIGNPSALRRDAAGNVYILQAGRTIRVVSPDGKIGTLHAVPEDQRVYDFAVSADGQALYLTGAQLGANFTLTAGRVVKIDVATGAETVVHADASGQVRLHVIALDGQDRLHLIGNGELRRWDGEAGFTTVGSEASLKTPGGWRALGRAIFDAQGRLYYFTGADAAILNRFDPASGKAEVIAGVGGGALTGEGVDDSFLNGMGLAFDAKGDLLFCDLGHNQVKRVPAASL